MLQNVHTSGNHLLTVEANSVYDTFRFGLRQAVLPRALRKTAILLICKPWVPILEKDTALPVRHFPRLAACCTILLCGFAYCAAAAGQEAEAGEQMLVDAGALVMGTEVTTRCAVFDASIAYLTPLEQVAATLRLSEMLAAASEAVENVPDRAAGMRADAAEMACGSSALIPYMDFSRQVAHDMIDIALVAWRSIDIGRCNYFADDDFLTAADRARETAGTATIEGEANRRDYIAQRAAAWVSLFADNCANLRFDPVKTVPGQIALALPTE